jgi:hypothetical protein
MTDVEGDRDGVSDNERGDILTDGINVSGDDGDDEGGCDNGCDDDDGCDDEGNDGVDGEEGCDDDGD